MRVFLTTSSIPSRRAPEVSRVGDDPPDRRLAGAGIADRLSVNIVFEDATSRPLALTKL